jgi:hypothetical protein
VFSCVKGVKQAQDLPSAIPMQMNAIDIYKYGMKMVLSRMQKRAEIVLLSAFKLARAK